MMNLRAFKKIFALVLALMLFGSACIPAFAASDEVNGFLTKVEDGLTTIKAWAENLEIAAKDDIKADIEKAQTHFAELKASVQAGGEEAKEKADAHARVTAIANAIMGK